VKAMILIALMAPHPLIRNPAQHNSVVYSPRSLFFVDFILPT